MKVRDNILTKGFSGTVDRFLTFSQRAGETFVAKLRRPSSKEATDKMIAVRLRFSSSSAYAKRAIRDLQIRSLYQKVVKGRQSAYNLALADAYNAPKVNSIDAESYHGAVGDAVTINATDDFKVVSVLVAIHDASGNLVEQGNAVTQEDKPDWLYKTTQVNRAMAGSMIKAIATDLPGNTAELELTLP